MDDAMVEMARKKAWLENGNRRQMAEMAAMSRIAAALIVSPHFAHLLPDMAEPDSKRSEQALRHIGYIAATIAGELWDYSQNVWNGEELDDVKADDPEVEVALAELRGKTG